MKLQATRDDGRQKRIRRGRGKDQRRRAGWLLEDFQKNVGDIPAHGLRAIEDEDAAAAHGLKVGGTLDGAQLAHPQHGARDGALQADRVGHERPHVRVRLEDQRHALDCRCVGTLAALGESLFEQRSRIGELGNALARGALAAEIIREALAIRGLRKHTRESEFANAARAGEKQCMGDTSAAKSATERRDNPFVAEKLLKGHDQPPPAPESCTTCVEQTLFTAARTSWAISSGERIALRAASKHSMVTHGASRARRAYMSAACSRWRRLASKISCLAVV